MKRFVAFIEGNPYSGIFISLGTFLFVVLLGFTPFYEIFELKLYDFRFRMKPPIEEWDRLVFADMDDNSIIAIGSFPWPRRIYARGLEVLKQVGARQVTLDIIFPDKSPQQIDEKAYRTLSEKGVVIRGKDLQEIILDNDRIFSGAIADMGKVFIPYNFTHQPPTRDLLDLYRTERFKKARLRFLERASIVVNEDERSRYRNLEDPDISGISYPIPEIMETAHAFGYVDRDSDSDGTLRRIRLVRYYDGRLYFNLAMEMLCVICDVRKENIAIIPGHRILLKSAFNPVTQERRDISIPIDEKGMMMVNWAGPGPREKSFRAVPFYSLIDYSIFANIEGGVYDILDELAGPGGITALAEMGGEISDLETRYRASDSPAQKREILKVRSALQKRIWDTKRGFLKVYDDEIAQLQKELQRGPNPELKADLEEKKTIKKACEVVLMVESLKDSIVVAGLTGTSSHDLTTIPIATDYARVGAYFNTINTVLQNRFIHRVGFLTNCFIMLLISIAIGYVIKRLKARMALLVITGSAIGLSIAIILAFVIADIWVDQLGITLSLLLPSTILGSIKFINEESQKRFIKMAFSYYLAPGVIDEIIQNPDSLVLGGENREITIFFSDVASFSSISEKLTPPELVSFLNEYLSEMTEIILSYSGTVDKYIGDAIMAFYGAPTNFPDHAMKACLAAIDMKRRLRELQEEWRKSGRQDIISARMGINTGMAVVGNMGSKSKMDYTAMGDAVNLASRLEGANKYYSTNAMISESTYEMVKEQVEARRLDIIRVVGKKEAVGIYELLGKKGTLPDRMYGMLEKYTQALGAFEERDWKHARHLFRQGLQTVDDDGPSLTYIERCNQFLRKPPPKNWDGVYSMKSK
ncbi:MAG: CHASE2 domain-containing protein [Spirochaetes bacterium]|nr:CHASE2 domain-containing protein [Spirochaetota bacterium]